MVALLETVLGQQTAIETLQRGLAGARSHHAYLFEGPPGVGKERAAFGLAQALLCEHPTEERLACGMCSSCDRAVPKAPGGLCLHPDVVILERGLYEPSQIGRKTPELKEISIDQVRTLVLARAAFPPHEGRAKVFVVRRADELSISAANALLKTLEEPGRNTHFILLTSRKAALLSTIRSRTLSLRFGHLSNAVVARILSSRGVPEPAATDIAELAGGSVETALSFADPEGRSEIETFVARMRTAVAAKDAGEGFALAEEGKKGKAELPSLLAGLSLAFAKDARGATVRGDDEEAERSANRYAMVEHAMRKLHGNGSPQLVVEGLVIGLRTS